MEIKNPQPPLSYTDFKISGRYYNGGLYGGTTSTIALTANLQYSFPFVVAKSENYDRIAIEVSTADAVNVNLRMGIYYNNPLTNLPGNLLIDAGAVSVATTGKKEITISQTLKPGLYWLSLIADGTPTIKRTASISGATGMGWTSTTGYAGRYVTNAGAYGVLISPHPASTIEDSAGVSQYIWLRYL